MIINKESEEKKLSNNILSLAQVAAAAKRCDSNVINATIGMYNDNDNSFYAFNAVKEVMKDIDHYSAFAYSDTDGGKLFQEAILKWVFNKQIEAFSEHHVAVVATPGGSGAISTTFQNYLNPGEKVLLPNHMWETYLTFLKERNVGHLRYNISDSCGNFDINDLKNKILELNQQRVMIVINDPCHNPTGFCMSDTDYDNLVNLLNELSSINFVLLMDVAYFDFYDSDGSIIRKRFAKLANLKENSLINFAFSGSKTFGLYGLRIGASILFSRNLKEAECFKNAITFTARSNWSSVSSLGIAIITRLVLDDKYNIMFTEEVKKVSHELTLRSDAFIKEANRIGLPMLPFNRGFFLCVPHENPVLLMETLHKYDAYVVVTKSCIRVALCAINQEEAKVLPRKILKAIEELG